MAYPALLALIECALALVGYATLGPYLGLRYTAYTPGPVVGGAMACSARSSAGLDTPVQSWANSP